MQGDANRRTPQRIPAIGNTETSLTMDDQTQKVMRQKIVKWYDACTFFVNNYSEISQEELEALKYFMELWKQDKWNEDIQRRCNEYVNILNKSDKLHSNNKKIIEWSKVFRGIASAYYCKDQKTFVLFRDQMLEYSRSHPFPQFHVVSRQQEMEQEYRQESPSIQITSVDFADTDTNGNILRDYSMQVYSDFCYLTPRIHFRPLVSGSIDFRICYKLYDPGFNLLSCGNSPSGFTWYGNVNSRAGIGLLGGFGSETRQSYMQTGTWTIEFYEDRNLLYKTKFMVRKVYSPRPASRWKKWLLGIMLLLGVFWIGSKFIGNDKSIIPIEESRTVYVLADNLFLRSSKSSASNSNIIDKVVYGTELTLIADDGNWTEISVNGKKGFVSSDFLLEKSDFLLLDGIWGNEQAKELITSSKYRKAVLDYIKRNNLRVGENDWLIYAKNKSSVVNSVLFPRFEIGNELVEGFVFILTNNVTGEKRTIVYTFTANDSSTLVHEERASHEGIMRNITFSRIGTPQYRVEYGISSQKSNISPSSAPIITKVEETQSVSIEQKTPVVQQEDNSVYSLVDKMPTFPGGISECFSFIQKNLKYPEKAMEDGVQGKVVVEFIVGKQGDIEAVRIAKGVEESLDKEAMRVVKAMPRWIPGMKDGKNVRVKFSLPITFKLT